MQRHLFLIALACAAPAAVAADVYKWTDAGGVVHYSDTEPATDVQAARLHLTGSIATETDATSTPAAGDAAGAAEAPGADSPKLASSGQNADKLCDQARSNLELLQSKYAVGLDPTGSGKPEMLDDNARRAQIAHAQSLIATNCK